MATTRHAADVTTWRIERPPVRTLPAATRTLLFLMLDRWVSRSAEEEGDYNKRALARLLPTLLNGRAIQVAELHPIAPQRRLGLGEPPPEPLARDPQRVLGIDLHAPRERDDGEQQVAHLLEGTLGIARLRQLARLLGDVLGRLRGRLEIKSHSGRALLQAERPRERRQRRRHAIDDRLVRAPAVPRLVALRVLPVLQHFVRIRDGDIAEHVRMPRHHLGRDRLRYLRGIEAPLLGGDLRVHRDLEQEVAQLFLDLGVVARVDRLEELVGLLEQVGSQRLVRLHPVPRTAPWRAQPGHDLEDRGHAWGERWLGR